MTKKDLDYVVIDYIDCEFHIKKVNISQREFINKLQLLDQKYSRKTKMADKGLISEDAMKEMSRRKMKEMAVLYAENIIVDWKGSFRGEKLPKYTSQKCAEILGDHRNDLLFGDIIQTSIDHAAFEAEIDEEEIKN